MQNSLSDSFGNNFQIFLKISQEIYSDFFLVFPLDIILDVILETPSKIPSANSGENFKLNEFDSILRNFISKHFENFSIKYLWVFWWFLWKNLCQLLPNFFLNYPSNSFEEFFSNSLFRNYTSIKFEKFSRNSFGKTFWNLKLQWKFL